MDKVKNTEQFIEKATKLHNGKYDYSKVEYKNTKTKICIICPIHGEFWQDPHSHLKGSGCSKCRVDRTKKALTLSTEEFINRARKKNGDKYDYSKTKYIDTDTNVTIICPIHGEFKMSPHNHLKGHGCPRCSFQRLGLIKRKTLETFIGECKQVHGDKYDYSKVEYINNDTKVCIVCSKHGEFWQKPVKHLGGQGCPICKQSHLENEIWRLLKENHIEFERQKMFDWLGALSLDFYLPQYKIAIECQGRQHFGCFTYYGGEEGYQVRLARDKKKLKLCQDNGVRLLYYTKEAFNEFLGEKIYRDLEELLVEVR